MAMGHPGLLQELPHIAALLPEAGADREQACATKRPCFGLNAVTDFSLNHGRAQGTFRAIVGGLYIVMIQESPQRLLALEQVLAGAHRLGPGCLFATLMPQLHHPSQRLFKFGADRPTLLPQVFSLDFAGLPAVPVLKQLLPQTQ